MTKILAGVIALLLIVCGVQAYMVHGRGLRIQDLNHQLHTQKTDLANCKQASRDDAHTIDDLTAKLKKAAGIKQDVEQRAQQAEQRAAAAEASRDTALAKLQRQREKTYATHPHARAWSLGRVPGVLSEQLRNEWEHAAGRGTAHQGGGGAGAAVRGNSGKSDRAPAAASTAASGL